MRPLRINQTLSMVFATVILFAGCESVGVDIDSSPQSSGNSGTTGGKPSTPSIPDKENTTKITIAPETWITTKGDTSRVFSIVSPVDGHTYMWTLSDAKLGKLEVQVGKTVTYTNTNSTTNGTQTLTVTESATGRKGTATITYQADSSN